MNKNIFFIVLVVLVVGAGIYMSNTNNVSDTNSESKVMTDESSDKMAMEDKNESMMKEDDKMAMEDDKMAMDKKDEDESMMKEDDDKMMMASGEYVDYDSELVSRANEGDVVLFFHATWCPSCKTMDTALKNELSKFPKGLTVLKVDYDSSSELKKKYGVTYQHTFVQVDAQGNAIAKWNGGSDLDDLLGKLK